MNADSVRRERAMELFRAAYEYQMKGNLAEAVRLYSESIETCPTAEAHTFLGWTYSFMGRLDEAIAECHRAISVDPTFGNPYNDIGAYLLQQGRIDEAIPWFGRAIESERYESYFFPHTNLGRAYEAKRQYLLAMKSYRRALQEQADYQPALEGLARLTALMN